MEAGARMLSEWFVLIICWKPVLFTVQPVVKGQSNNLVKLYKLYKLVIHILTLPLNKIGFMSACLLNVTFSLQAAG